MYPYPRTPAANDTDWLPGAQRAFHPNLRASFNGTRYNLDGFLEVYKVFSKTIGTNFEQWQQWRDFYVASPDSWDPKSRGGIVTTMGFNGGKTRAGVTLYAPNAGYFVVEEIKGRRWITEIREQSTLASAFQLPKDGQLWKCRPEYEICG